MNRIPFIKWLLLFCFFTGLQSKGEIFFSSKYGFIAEFPSKPEKIEASSPTGDLANFWVTVEKPFLVLTVNAQKRNDYANFVKNPPSEALQKRLLTTDFEVIRKIDSLSDVELKWVENAAFPVLRASFSQVGLIGENVKSYELSYWMLLGDTIYRIKAQGMAPAKFEAQIAKLYKSFMVVDSKVLDQLMKSVKKPSSLNKSNFAQVKLPLGVSIKIPKNWWVISGDLKTTLEAAAEAALDLSGLDIPAEKVVDLITANSMPRSTYAGVSITASDAEFDPEDLRTLTKEDLAETSLEMKKVMARVLKEGGFTIEEFEPLEIVKLDGFYGIRLKYQRSGPKGSVVVTVTRYVAKGKEISISISYRKKEAAIWKPITTFMSKSIYIRPNTK